MPQFFKDWIRSLTDDQLVAIGKYFDCHGAKILQLASTITIAESIDSVIEESAKERLCTMLDVSVRK